MKKNGTTKTGWKLRSASSNNTTHYNSILNTGAMGSGKASTNSGVSPAFRIG